MKKKSNADKFEEAQFELYTHIDWLHNTGRLTLEEHSKLINNVADCLMAATVLGFSEGEK